jgi:GNAT superfamily N-acetyltransferase
MVVTVAVAGAAEGADARRVMRRVLDEDLGGYRARWHCDVDDPVAAYVRADRSALFVAWLVSGEDAVRRMVGTAAVRPCGLQSPPNPDWLARRYSRPAVCELRRVWVVSEARRRGVAAALVRAAARWATAEGGYETVYLHTDAGVPGAEAFWRSMPTAEVHDARPDPWNCVHFVLSLDKLLHADPAETHR